MKFSIVIPGQPPTINHMYQVVRGSRRIAKAPEVERYQSIVTFIARTVRPKEWKYEGGYVRLWYDFHLKRDIDCDNAKKAINDAIAIALEVNDRMFLTCDRDKTTKVAAPEVIVEVEYPWDGG